MSKTIWMTGDEPNGMYENKEVKLAVWDESKSKWNSMFAFSVAFLAFLEHTKWGEPDAIKIPKFTIEIRE